MQSNAITREAGGTDVAQGVSPVVRRKIVISPVGATLTHLTTSFCVAPTGLWRQERRYPQDVSPGLHLYHPFGVHAA
jgi:hypothetical protein